MKVNHVVVPNSLLRSSAQRSCAFADGREDNRSSTVHIARNALRNATVSIACATI